MAAARRVTFLAGVVFLTLFILLAGTPDAEVFAEFRLINGVVAAFLITIYAWNLGRDSDAIDRIALGALLCFAVASLLSRHPRQSLDALLTMLAYVALFYVMRRGVNTRHQRNTVVFALAALSLVVTSMTFVRQLAPVLEWIRLTDGTVAPPLALSFNGWPWGNRYDSVILAVMLYPAWWVGPRGWLRRGAAVVVGAALAWVAVVAGSRNIWLGLLGASAVLIAPVLLRDRARRRVAAMALGVLVVIAVTVVVVIEPLRDRLFVLASAGQRWAMWESLIEAWWQQPLAGHGIGSFPWILGTTDYFDTNTIAPRHPDSAIFQLLAEAGVLGLVGAAAVVVGIGGAVLRSGRRGPTWALTFFGIACITANPTSFAFLIAVAICWAAVALPRTATEPDSNLHTGSRRIRTAVAIGLALVFAVQGVAIVAAFRYQAAYGAIDRSDFVTAIDNLQAAANLDPSNAIYHRQLGTARLVAGDPHAAVEALSTALNHNPADDLGWRTLALAHLALGDREAADSALERAIEVQRSDPTNLLLKLWLGTGNATEERDLVAELLLAWPSLATADGWNRVAPDGLATREATSLALDRWLAGGPAPEPTSDQPLRLIAMADRPELGRDAAVAAGLPQSLLPAAVATFTCDPAASGKLASIPAADRQSIHFWLMSVMAAQVGGSEPREALQVLRLLGQATSAPRGERLMNPFRENDIRGWSADIWGYRRLPFPWSKGAPLLPDPRAGKVQFLLHWRALACS